VHFQTKLILLIFLCCLIEKQQPPKHLGLCDELIKFLNKEFAFYIQTLNENDKKLKIVWIVFAYFVVIIVITFFYDFVYDILDKSKINFLDEYFLIFVKFNINIDLP